METGVAFPPLKVTGVFIMATRRRERHSIYWRQAKVNRPSGGPLLQHDLREGLGRKWWPEE